MKQKKGLYYSRVGGEERCTQDRYRARYAQAKGFLVFTTKKSKRNRPIGRDGDELSDAVRR